MRLCHRQGEERTETDKRGAMNKGEAGSETEAVCAANLGGGGEKVEIRLDIGRGWF